MFVILSKTLKHSAEKINYITGVPFWTSVLGILLPFQDFNQDIALEAIQGYPKDW